jgi:hypothetical protein
MTLDNARADMSNHFRVCEKYVYILIGTGTSVHCLPQDCHASMYIKVAVWLCSSTDITTLPWLANGHCASIDISIVVCWQGHRSKVWRGNRKERLLSGIETGDMWVDYQCTNHWAMNPTKAGPLIFSHYILPFSPITAILYLVFRYIWFGIIVHEGRACGYMFRHICFSCKR